MKVASISELKDGLSAHLDLVQAGETVVVTDRRTPVATLQRIAPETLWEGLGVLIAGGVVAPRGARLEVAEFLAMPKANCSGGLSEAIVEERREGR